MMKKLQAAKAVQAQASAWQRHAVVWEEEEGDEGRRGAGSVSPSAEHATWSCPRLVGRVTFSAGLLHPEVIES